MSYGVLLAVLKDWLRSPRSIVLMVALVLALTARAALAGDDHPGDPAPSPDPLP